MITAAKSVLSAPAKAQSSSQIHMDINDLFHSPKGSQVAAFSQAQLHLYRHDTSLQDYFLPLQGRMNGLHVDPRHHRPSNRFFDWAALGANRVSQLRRRAGIKVDILFCPMPYFSRKTETQFLVRTLLGLAETDATILCLMPIDAPCRDELDAKLASAGRSCQVTFLDPTSSMNPVERRLLSMVARIRGALAFEATVGILEPHGLRLSRDVRSAFEHTAFFVEAWDRLAPTVDFDAVVARCHWHALCSSVCRTAQQRGKPAITFQQGVIAHTLDVPVTASKYVAFGEPSASFLARVNHRFFQAAEMPEAPVEYVSGGCLFDNVIALPDQFDNRTLLMVDVPAGQSDFYGIENQSQALLRLAEKLLAADLPLRRLIIRPHPYWGNLDFEACQRLVREHSTRCELSHPVWSLEDDLRRSSIVVGIFSGALTVASACGLPTIFLETEDGYTTGDLACFSPRQTLTPEDTFCVIGKLLVDQQAYADARTEALGNGREYYANGTNLELNGTFFGRLLRVDPPTYSTPA